MTVIITLIRVVLGFVFIYASFDKIIDPMAFAGIVHNYQILPDILISPLALVLPWLEFVCGALLITGVLTRASSLIIIIMLVVFMAALVYNGSRGLDIACGCFSTDASSTESVMQLLIRDAVFIVMSSTVCLFSSRHEH